MSKPMFKIAAFHFVHIPLWVPRRIALWFASAVATHVNRRGQEDPPSWAAGFVLPGAVVGGAEDPDDPRVRDADQLVFERLQCGLVQPIRSDGSDTHAFTYAVKLTAPNERLLRSARFALGITSAIIPARVDCEEFGDALEEVEQRIAAGRPRVEVLLKIYASVFWALWHTVLYAAKGVTDALGRKGG